MASASILQSSKHAWLVAVHFLTTCLKPEWFELLYADTDSLYMSLTYPSLIHCVSPSKMEYFLRFAPIILHPSCLPPEVNEAITQLGDSPFVGGTLELEKMGTMFIAFTEKAYALYDSRQGNQAVPTHIKFRGKRQCSESASDNLGAFSQDCPPVFTGRRSTSWSGVRLKTPLQRIPRKEHAPSFAWGLYILRSSHAPRKNPETTWNLVNWLPALKDPCLVCRNSRIVVIRP